MAYDEEPPRRAVLKRGLAVGAALLAGNTLLAGCDSLRQGATAGSRTNKHMISAIPWQGIDYAWLSDSTHLAYVSNRGLFIVDAKSGSQIWRQKVWPDSTYQGTRTISWSANGTRVVSIAANTCLVQDVQTGQNIWSYRDDQSTLLAAVLSPYGTLLALAQASSSALVQIWNVQERKLVAQCGKPDSQQLDEIGVQSLLWSPDGTRIVATSLNGAVYIWQAASERLLHTYDDQRRVALSWSPDSAALAFATIGAPGEALLGIWDVESGQTRFQAPASVSVEIQQTTRANPVAWSPDGTCIAFIAQDHNVTNIEVWSVRSSQRLFTCQSVSGAPTGITWSPDGRYLAAGNVIVGSDMLAAGNNGENSVVQFWNANDGRALFTYNAPKSPDRLAWSPDGHHLALITPRVYGILPNKTCLSLCRYGYEDTTLEIFQVT